ncbi:MAG: lipopolysaccharide export system permease protein [Planctomycetota bacterium]|jgi:lipopolysaccharide export system permease protein
MRQSKLKIGGLLDRYVLVLFTASYSIAFFLVIGMFLILDMVGHLDDFMEVGPDGSVAASTEIIRYYLYNTPFVYLQVAPFVTLIAGLFTASKLVRNNEIVAALNAGVSAQRLIAPILVGGGILAAGMFGLREWATEGFGYRRDLALHRIVEREPELVYEQIWLKLPHDSGTNLIRIEEFRDSSEEGGQAVITGLVATIKTEVGLSTINAKSAVYENGDWHLKDGTYQVVEGPEENPRKIEWLGDVKFTPRDVYVQWKGQERPLDLSFQETTELWRRDPDNVQFQTLVEYLKTFPLANIVLLLVGLPFLVSYGRSRRSERMVAGFLLCVFYFAADFVTRSLGMQGSLSPLMASWLPVLFFGSLGVVIFSSMRT